MATYKIEEATTFLARREPRTIKAKSLASAKRVATRGQCFYGTVLHIYSETGELLAHKVPYCGGQAANWINA